MGNKTALKSKKPVKKAKVSSKNKPSKTKSIVIIKKDKKVPDLISAVDVPIFNPIAIKSVINYIAKGRPETEFKPEYAETILNMMAQGMGIETVCMHLGISYTIMKNWRKNSKEIDSLIKYGIQLEKQWWLEQGRRNIYNKDFNHVLWMMNMSNRFDWTTNKREVNGKVAHAHLHQVNGKVELEEKVKESNDCDRISTVLSILSKSGKFVRREPVKRIADSADTETN